MAKLFGSIAELVKVVFRVDNQAVGIQPNTSTTYTADRDFDLPPGDSDQTLVSESATQTVTNKTIDGDDNTVQDLPDTAIKTVLANADKFFTRDGSGVPTSAAKDVPSGAVVGTTDAQTLTTKTIDADNNSISNIDDDEIKAAAAINATKIADGSVDNTEYQRLGAVTSALVGETDSQTLTNKTIDADNNTISNLAHGAEVDNPSSGVHGVTGSVVGTSDTQVLTNKDIDGGTAADNRRITLPKDTTTNLNGLTRKEATLVYDTDTSSVKYDNGTNLVEISGASAASADGDTAGIVTTFTPTVKSRVNSVSSANYTVLDDDGYETIAVSTGATTRTVTLPTASANTGRKLTITKTDSGAGYITVDGEGAETVNGLTTVSVIFQYDFIEVLCTGSEWLIINQQHSTQWMSFTPTVALTTNATSTGLYKRVGDEMHVQVKTEFSGANTQGSWTITIPDSLNIDTSKLIHSTVDEVMDLGTATIWDGTGTDPYIGVMGYDSGTSVKAYASIELDANATALWNEWRVVSTSSSDPFGVASGDHFTCFFRVPITEWDGR